MEDRHAPVSCKHNITHLIGGGMAMDRWELLRRLKGVSGAAELYEMTQYVGYRQDPDGEPGEIVSFQIQVLDAGPDASPESRYLIVTQDDDDRMVTGEESRTIEDAIAAVDWRQLDEPPDLDDD